MPPTAVVAPTAPALHTVSYGAHVGLIGIDPTPILNGVTAMRFEWIAQTIYWRDVEPSQGQYAWDKLDAVVAPLSSGNYSLRLLAVVRGTPDWARPAGADLTRDGPPTDNAALGEFLHALAGRYTGQVAAYEIYPEANDARHWASPQGISPQAYAALLQTASTSIRSADPLAIVVSGGLEPTDVDDGLNAMDPSRFLGAMYAAGAGQWLDAVGVHLDGRNNPPSDTPQMTTTPKPGFKGLWAYYFRNYEALHAVMAANGDYRHPMWLTGVGWASAAPPPDGMPYAADNTEDEQAGYLVGAAYQVRTQPYVQVMIVENFNLSVLEGAGPREAAYSLIRPDWSARPAFLALAKMRQADVLPASAESGAPMANLGLAP
ncbi:MAG: hypothetical protein HY260_13825 [Chloroflexi bacterium]|nr:hypothetical protein [Chloroflexota bacterium]